MPKKQSNEITYFFVTQDSRTKRGGRVSRVTNKAKYQGMALARVGDIVTYDDRSEATINDDPAYTLPPNVARDGGNIHRAATRQAIINRARQEGMNLMERSDWAAHKNRSARMTNDWDYSKIAIHHAGRSFSCGPAALQLQEIQDMQMGKSVAPSDDIGYHYALDCHGNIFEGRDIRFKGESVHNYNTGVIGIVLLQNLTDSEEGGDGVAKIRKFLDTVGLSKRPQVPDKQKQSVNKFIDILREFFYINTLGGHREFPGQLGEGKICPGSVGLSLVKELRNLTGLSAP